MGKTLLCKVSYHLLVKISHCKVNSWQNNIPQLKFLRRLIFAQSYQYPIGNPSDLRSNPS